MRALFKDEIDEGRLRLAAIFISVPRLVTLKVALSVVVVAFQSPLLLLHLDNSSRDFLFFVLLLKRDDDDRL